MPRGGKRAGAGRRPAFPNDEFAKYFIGASCEVFQKRLIERRVNQEVAKRTVARSTHYAELHNRPLRERQKGLTVEDWENYEFAVREDEGIDAYSVDDIPREKLSGMIRIPKVRPKGARGRILKLAQRMIRCKYGKEISTFTIADYWKWYRRKPWMFEKTP